MSADMQRGGRLCVLVAAWLVCWSSLYASDATRRSAQAYPPDASQQAIPLTTCATGSTTTLQCGGLTRSKRHNGNQGEAHFALLDKKSGAVLWKDEYVGESVCLGYSTARRMYVVGSTREHGVGIRLRDLRYLDEATQRARISALNRAEIEAFSAVPSPDLRYIALVALKGNDVSVFALDTLRDRIRMLGKAPLPPPLSEEERAYVKNHPDVLQEGPWEWLGSLRDSYLQMDPGILEFEGNDVLKVSYGADTPFRRAPGREIKKWRLGPG